MNTTVRDGGTQEVLLPRQAPSVADGARPAGGDAHLLRAPVYDGALAFAGYELVIAGEPGDEQRAEAVAAALTEVPSSVLAAGGVLFARLPQAFLTGDRPVPVAPGSVVLEVPENLLGDPRVVAGLSALTCAGHRLSLVGSTWNPALRPLLPLFAVARVDVATVGTAGLAAVVSRLSEHRIALFVEGVDTLNQLDSCRHVRAEFLSGALVSRPPVITDRGLVPSQLACLRLATALLRPEIDLTEVELAVRSDPALTMRVLKAVNSVSGGLRHRVSSIRQAVVLLGPRALLGTVLRIGLSQSGTETPPEAVEAVLVRARMCELLATTALPARGTAVDGSAAFTVGLVAGLDALLGTSLTDIVAELPVDEAVESAVLARSGPLGIVLADVLAYETGGPTELMDVGGLRTIFLASLSWAAPLMG